MSDPKREAARLLDAEVVKIQDEHHARWRTKRRWIIVAEDAGTYTVHEHSATGVAPPTNYPSKRSAVSRLLQLLGIGPVGPQPYSEDIRVGSVTYAEGEER